MKRSRSRPPSRKAISNEPAPISVLIVNRQKQHKVQTEKIRNLLERAALSLKVTGELSVVFGGDTLLRRLNRDFRFKDAPTDVLSFEGQDEDMGLGDVIISVETARRNAAGSRHTLDRELEILALHGFLHALGFDHETDQGEMETIEKKLRARLLSRKRTFGRPSIKRAAAQKAAA